MGLVFATCVLQYSTFLDTAIIFKKLKNLLVLEGEGGTEGVREGRDRENKREREREKEKFVVPLIYALIG